MRTIVASSLLVAAWLSVGAFGRTADMGAQAAITAAFVLAGLDFAEWARRVTA